MRTTGDPKPGTSSGRTRVFAATAVGLGLLVGIAALEVTLGYQRARIQASDQMDPGMVRYDATLGWRLTPGWTGAHRNHDFEVTYSINRLGFRGRSDLTQPGRRIGVNDDETLVAALNKHFGDAAAAFNFAIPGYSTDQQVLLAERVLPRVRMTDLVLVVYLGNDLIDNMFAFPVQGPRGKPYYQLTAQRLVQRNTPVSREPKSGADLGVTYTSVVLASAPPPSDLDRLIGSIEIVRRLGITWPPPRHLFPGAEGRFRDAVDLFVALSQKLRAAAAVRGTKLHVVLLPGRSYFADPNGYSAQYQEHIRGEIIARADAIGVPITDLGARLRTDLGNSGATSQYFRYDGHLTAGGNRTVAALIANALGLRP